MIFAKGEIVECKVVKFNKKLDIAILQIIKKECDQDKVYPSIEIFQDVELKKYEELVCIG